MTMAEMREQIAPSKKRRRPKRPREPRPKGGPLAMRAGIICAEGAFHQFMSVQGQEAAADKVRSLCGISSRSELDHNPQAGEIFSDILSQYELWLRE